MKIKNLLLLPLIIYQLTVAAQHTGINITQPLVALDVKGALALRPDTVLPVSAAVTTFNVAQVSYLKFSSDNPDPQQRFINLTPGSPGQLLTLEFSGGGAARMINGSGLTTGGKLLLSADMIFDSPSLIALISDGKHWRELYRQAALKLETSADSVTYNSPGVHSFKVPPGITKIRIMLMGAGGWGGGANSNPLGVGGRGGMVSGELTVTEGETLEIGVGAGGSGGQRAQATFIRRGGAYLAMAGAGGNGNRLGGNGGNAGPSGSNGTLGTDAFLSGGSGNGATPLQGGAGGVAGSNGQAGQTGTALTGGIVSSYNPGEGWGGNGWFGGGASGTFNYQFYLNGPYAAGGGGGGSNYSALLTGEVLSNGNGANGGSGTGTGNAGTARIWW